MKSASTSIFSWTKGATVAVRRSCSSPGGSGHELAHVGGRRQRRVALCGQQAQGRRLAVEADALEVGAHPRRELAGGQAADEAPVHPAQLLGIEDAGARAQAFDVEAGDEVVERPVDHRLVELGRQEAQVVAHDLNEKAHAEELFEVGGAVALGQLLAVGAEQQRHVQEVRGLRAERFVDQDLLGRVREVVVTADDVAHGHGDVVDDHRQVVGDRAVGALHDEVADGLVGHFDRAAQQVVERGQCRDARESAASRARRPPRGGRRRPPAGRGTRRCRPRRACRPGRRCARPRAPRACGSRCRGGLRRAGARCTSVDVLTLGLAVGTVGAGLLGTLIPVELHLAQRTQDLGDRRVGRARRVGVFYAQHEVAAVPTRVEVVVERGACSSEVEVAGGGRCEADADGLGHGGPFYPTRLGISPPGGEAAAGAQHAGERPPARPNAAWPPPTATSGYRALEHCRPEDAMRHRTPRAAVIGLLVIAAAAWAAAAATPTARAAGGGTTVAVKAYSIPASATAILGWTFKTPPATATRAVFQVSRDKTHWTTLKVIKVAKGTRRVRTTWKAASRAEVRYFRFQTATDLSNLVKLRV